jgi:hypothetical protein
MVGRLGASATESGGGKVALHRAVARAEVEGPDVALTRA